MVLTHDVRAKISTHKDAKCLHEQIDYLANKSVELQKHSVNFLFLYFHQFLVH